MRAAFSEGDITALENDGLQMPCEELATRTLLKKLARTWERRAQVKKDEIDVKTLLDDNRDDFLPALLPFKDHPAFLAAPDSMKQKILSCGWLAYNEKTVDIESKIVTPACIHVIYGEVPGLQDGMSRQVASQTLVDEAYHILLVAKASYITKVRRGLGSVTFPASNLIAKMQESQKTYQERWQQILVQLVTAIVSEVFISDYLKLLSNETSIQPFNRLTVDTHRRDELAHSGLFKVFTKYIYTSLGSKEREFFMDILPKPVRWFANMELDVWNSILKQIKFPQTETVINDCKNINEENLARIDFSDLISLASELGILDTQRGLESFYREGLMDNHSIESSNTFVVNL